MGRVSFVGMYRKENSIASSMKEMVKPLIPIRGKRKCQKIQRENGGDEDGRIGVFW
jgi:hypothetical protein